jgi:phosphatidylinositol alpha-mannosyltransferase
VHILAPSSADTEKLYPNHVYRLGSIIRVPYHGSWARITLSVGLRWKVRTILRQEQFDLIHVHEPLLPMLPLVAVHEFNGPRFATFHASWDRSLLYAIGQPVLQRWFRRLDVRIAVSEAARQYVGRYFAGDYTIIPNGIDVATFRPMLPRLERVPVDRQTVLFVGRLEQRKGFTHLLRAFASVEAQEHRAHLVVAGAYGTREQHYYARRAEELGVREITFLGRLTREELARCYASVDIFCAPSTGGESFGIVLLEAMAAGRPVVCSDIDGYREVVRHGVEGLLVPPADAEMLAEALLQLLRDDELRQAYGAAGRRRAAEFDWSIVAEKVESCYYAALRR